MTTRRFRALCLAAAQALDSGEASVTWEAVARATRHISEATALSQRFREVFTSETPWPFDDRETRVLAFLILAQVGRDDEVEELLGLIERLQEHEGAEGFSADLHRDLGIVLARHNSHLHP